MTETTRELADRIWATCADASAEQVEAAIADALKARDFPAVAALIKVLAVKDPAAAQLILDALDWAREAAT